MIRVSDYIADHLKAVGVRKAFLLSGGGMMHLIDALGVADLDYICGHHEQACAMAAEGYARQSGTLGVCYATSGPGATNLLTGLVGAFQDSSPVLFVTGQSKRSQTIRSAGVKGLRQFGTFEVDIVPIVASVTKYAHFLDDPATARYHLEKAIHLAVTGRPGPVLLDIPLDIQGALIDPAAQDGFEPDADASPPDPALMDKIADRLAQASRPVLLVGHGVRAGGAVPAFRALVEALGIPVVATQLAKDALPFAHPQFVGHCGPKGDRPGNFAIQSADLILSVGSSLHAQTIGYEEEFYAPDAFKIQVDIDPAVLGRGDVTVDLQVTSDVGAFLEALLALGRKPTDLTRWNEVCLNWKNAFAVAVEPHVVDTPEINFYEFADALSEALEAEATVVTDAGSAFYVMGQAFHLKDGQRYIVSGALGAMGYALPAAIGAAAAAPDVTVVCVTGDGSLQTNVHELQTLSHNQLNVKVFIVDNDGYASIRNTQKGFFAGNFVGASRDSGVSTPPLDKLADAFGLDFIAIDDRTSMAEQIRDALSRKGPVLVAVRAQPNQSVIPTVASQRLPDGSMRSNPLHVMSPLLPDEVLDRALNVTAGDQGQPADSPIVG